MNTFFTKKKGYATTICGLKEGEYTGRSENALKAYMNSLRGKERVRAVVMDLSDAYRKISLKHFPNAKIIAGRFHVVKLINHHFLKMWQQIGPEEERTGDFYL